MKYVQKIADVSGASGRMVPGSLIILSYVTKWFKFLCISIISLLYACLLIIGRFKCELVAVVPIVILQYHLYVCFQ